MDCHYGIEGSLVRLELSVNEIQCIYSKGH